MVTAEIVDAWLDYRTRMVNDIDWTDVDGFFEDYEGELSPDDVDEIMGMPLEVVIG